MALDGMYLARGKCDPCLKEKLVVGLGDGMRERRSK